MKKDSIFVQFFLIVVAVGSLLAAAAGYIISVPLIRTLTEAEERPLHLIADSIYGIASDSFHDLLDARKEDDPVEVETAKKDVLAGIVHFKPSISSAEYHYIVLGGDNQILADSGYLLDNTFALPVSEEPAVGEIRIPDKNGKTLIGYLRYFPGWDWRLITLTYEEELRSEARKIRLWIFSAGVVGFLLLMAMFYLVLKKRIQEPLDELVRHASRLEGGSYKVLAKVRKGEMGQLSAAFERMAAAIRERELKLSDLAKFPESNPNLLFKVSPDGEILYANPSVKKMLAEMGLAENEAARLLPQHIPVIIRELVSSDEHKKECIWKVRDRTIEYIVFGFADEDAVVFHGVDITEKKRMEEQLFHANKMETLGRIAGGVAHDFNNLLVGILGYASLMKSRPIHDEGVAKALESIERAAERGTQLTRQLLGFARKGTHEYLPLDLNKIVDETADIVSQTFIRTVGIRIDKAADLPPVMGDVAQLHQCLMNLCINARDAMPEGGGLSISTRRRSITGEQREQYSNIPPGDYVEVVVTDEGHGMDDATQQRIFDPFFTTKTPEKGTGLGMSMVYGIVKNHGGYITVKSLLGKGTSMELLFPAAERIQRQTEADQAGLPTIESSGSGNGGTVLLVDDEELVRDVGKAMLDTLGFEVITAVNGKEGVEAFLRNREKISIVILDLIMPVMDGRKAFEEIRQIDPAVRIVISTGYSGNEDVDMLKEMGACAILSKPYSYDTMTKVVNQINRQ
ncbi:MAG: Histidine kinase [Actinobacteria bacterium]|nr:Histidine kinase [Actinomycetota bacterium]MBM2828016.1 Histidine kinase [Actinomycetota bacterium]